MSPAVSEAVALLRAVLSAILASGFDSSGQAGADVRAACGSLDADAEGAVVRATVGAPLLACFDAARLAGATLEGMARVRGAAAVATPSLVTGKALAAGCVQLCLAQEAQILSATTFASRDDVEVQSARINQAFDDVEDAAADDAVGTVYRAFVALHAAVTRDLSVRASQLPRVVPYRTFVSMPSVVLANRYYGDAGRGGELVAENKVVHPLFMPLSGHALSA